MHIRILWVTAAYLILTTCTDQKNSQQFALFERAMEYFRSEAHEEAIVTASDLITKSNDAFIVGQSQFLRAYIYQLRDSTELAYLDYINALKNYRLCGRKDYESIIESKLGNLLYDYDSYKYAKKHFQAARVLAESINDDELTADAIYGLARTEKRLGNLVEAQSLMLEVLEMEANLERLANFIDTKLELAVIYHLGTSYIYAIEKNFEAIKSATGTNLEKYTRARAFHNIGRIYLKINELEKSEYYLKKSLKTEGRFDTQKAMTYNILGRLYHQKGNDLVAAKYFQKSARLNIFKVDVEELIVTIEGIKKLNIDDQEILSFTQIAETALREAHVKRKLEYAESRNFLEAEEMSMMLSESNAQKQKLTLALIGSALLVIISLLFIIVKVFGGKKNDPSLLTEDHLSFMREREKIRKRWEERLKN